jgi:hypothetical protein
MSFERLMPSYMTDKADLWREIATKYRLLDTPYEELVSWSFADFIFNSGFDNVSSTIKARKAGFAECIDKARREPMDGGPRQASHTIAS